MEVGQLRQNNLNDTVDDHVGIGRYMTRRTMAILMEAVRPFNSSDQIEKRREKKKKT